MVPALEPLARALAIRAIARPAGATTMNGAALTVLRADALTGAHDDHAAATQAADMFLALSKISIDDMPPPTDYVAILLETASQRLGGIGHAQVWRSIGVNPNRGRELLARNARAFDWPLWFTLFDAAFGDD